MKRKQTTSIFILRLNVHLQNNNSKITENQTYTTKNNNSKIPENQTYTTNTKLPLIQFEENKVVINIIRSLNVDKAHGHDNISI